MNIFKISFIRCGLGWADRVISIEMFEHMKNYQLLMKKVSNWIKPEGKVNHYSLYNIKC